MQLEQRQTLSQKLVLTQTMRQSLDCLQLSAPELAEYVQEVALSNPLLDVQSPTYYETELPSEATPAEREPLEVREAVEVLRGHGCPDLTGVCITLAANMLHLCNGWPIEEATKQAEEAISSGRAFEQMKRWIAAQGGDARVLDDVSLLPQAAVQYELKAPQAGYIHHMDAQKIGESSAILGAGRKTKDDTIDFAAGIVLKEKTGAKVRGIELSLLQRCAAHCASQTDIDESYMSGKTAVEEMLKGTTDKMVGFECDRTNGYTCKAKLFDLSDVANFEKKFPKEWINAEGNNVTEEFVKYALPLIQGETKLEKEDGLPRFARLKKVLVK